MSFYYHSRTYTPPRAISPQERQRRQINEAVDAAMQRALIRHQEEMSNLRKQHNDEKRLLDQKLDSLNSQFKDNIRQHQLQLNEMRQRYDRQLTEVIRETEQKRLQDKKQFDNKIHEAIDIVNANIANLQDSTQRAINATNIQLNALRNDTQSSLNILQRQINSLAEIVHNDKAKAFETRKTLKEACLEQLSIVQMKKHNKYAPNILQDIHARLKDVDALPDEAACASLIERFHDLLNLDASIEQARIQYETKHILVLKEAQEILTRMNENRNTITLTDENDNPLKNEHGDVVKIELDFWTENEYGKLEKQMEEIIEKIKNGLEDDKYTINDLDQALHQIHFIDERQNQLVIESIKRGNASQIRAEMADIIAEHLEAQRFKVIERGYEHGDARNAYFIKFQDTNSELVIVVNPESDEENVVIRKTIDTDLSEPDLILLNTDIDSLLQENGLGTSNGRCQSRNPISDEAWRQIYDMDVISQDIPSETKEKARIRDVRRERIENNNN